MATPARRILVVDDVPEILDFMRATALRIDATLDVRAVADPREALALLERERFDVVVSDLRMPHHGGEAVLAHARRHQPHARLALMTGYNELPDDGRTLGGLRIDAYLKKPSSTRELLAILADLLFGDERALERRRAHARRAEAAAGLVEHE